MRKRICSHGAQHLVTELSTSARSSKTDWTSAGKDALVWSWAGGSGPRPVTGLASQIAGLWVVRASITTPRTQRSPTSCQQLLSRPPPGPSARSPPGAQAVKKQKRRKSRNPPRPSRNRRSRPRHNAKNASPSRNACSTLLSQLEGASIDDMMQATKWQQHSVRGFLAGTVKKKLGFALTSSKLSGAVRRYRIETRRGR